MDHGDVLAFTARALSTDYNQVANKEKGSCKMQVSINEALA
jgi:hypothetical protein